MLRIGFIGLLLFSLTACNPFSKNGNENQFALQKDQLVFMGHKLGHWSNKAIPECTLCSLNVYTIKMAGNTMLFKQINDERGDLFFLAAQSVHYSFALKTGGYSYPIVIEIEGERTKITVAEQEPFYLFATEQKKVMLDGNGYVFEVLKYEQDYDTIDLNIWSDKFKH